MTGLKECFVILDDPAEKPAEATTEPKKHLSKGDTLFDRLVYTGLNNILTFVLSLGIAYGLKHGFKKTGAGNPASNAWFEKASKTLGEGLDKISTGLGKNAPRIMMTSALGVGGTLMIAPIKFLEDRRTQLVDRLNKMVGDTTDPAQLKEAPKQTWGSLILGRVAAWSVVFASLTGAEKLLGADRFTRFSDSFAEHVVAKPLGKSIKIHGKETAQFRLGNIAAIDLFATIAATLVLEISSKFFAGRREEKVLTKERAKQAATDRRSPDATPRTAPTGDTVSAAPSTQISAATLEKGPVQETAAHPQLS
jgi:hypothetical protein